MGRKLNPSKKPAAAERQPQVSEHDVLHPERGIRLRDRVLVVREYGYVEGMRLNSMIKPLVLDLYALYAKDDAAPSAEEVRDVFTDHAITLQWLMAQSITPWRNDPNELAKFTEEVAANAQWVNTLDDIEGDMLFGVWWGVLGGFFIRRFRGRLLAESAKATQSASQGSTPP